MSLHADLLRQARDLATVDPNKPKQASLRRAVSAAYYALFHLIAYHATRQIVGTARDRRPIRLALRRAFVHGTMKKVAAEFARGRVPIKMAPAIPDEEPGRPTPIPPGLMDVCQAFVDLQEARHEADYDVSRVFTRSETVYLVGLAEDAFRKWDAVRDTPHARVCVLAMLVLNQVRG